MAWASNENMPRRPAEFSLQKALREHWRAFKRNWKQSMRELMGLRPFASLEDKLQMPCWDGRLAEFPEWDKLFRIWYSELRVHLTTQMQVRALVEAMPEMGQYRQKKRSDRQQASGLTFHELYQLICEARYSERDPGHAEAYWTSARLPRRLHSDAMAGWFNDWLQRGAEVAGGVPHARGQRQLMGVMLHHEEYGATAGWSRMRQNVINKM